MLAARASGVGDEFGGRGKEVRLAALPPCPLAAERRSLPATLTSSLPPNHLAASSSACASGEPLLTVSSAWPPSTYSIHALHRHRADKEREERRGDKEKKKIKCNDIWAHNFFKFFC